VKRAAVDIGQGQVGQIEIVDAPDGRIEIAIGGGRPLLALAEENQLEAGPNDRAARKIQRQEPEGPTHPLFMVGQASWPVAANDAFFAGRSLCLDLLGSLPCVKAASGAEG
jgi:hypothetical protein